MRIIALANQKGGVGKTTTTLNVGAALSRRNRKVLLIDADPQGNLTSSVGLDVSQDYTLYELMENKCPIEKALHQSELGFDILPSDISLAGIEIELASEPGKEFILKEKVTPILEHYDYVLIDCPPSLGIMTVNALVLASEALVVLKPEYLPMQGLQQLKSTIRVIQRRLNAGLHISGILINMYDGRRKLHRQGAIMIEEHFPGLVFNSRIRNSTVIAESPGFHKDVYSYKPKASGSQDYDFLAGEIIAQEKNGGK